MLLHYLVKLKISVFVKMLTPEKRNPRIILLIDFDFRFTVLTAIHLQNPNAKFHKVGQRHYSGEAENVYISVRQIYSGQYVPNIIAIGEVL